MISKLTNGTGAATGIVLSFLISRWLMVGTTLTLAGLEILRALIGAIKMRAGRTRAERFSAAPSDEGDMGV
jgi:hypothetical protein